MSKILKWMPRHDQYPNGTRQDRRKAAATAMPLGYSRRNRTASLGRGAEGALVGVGADLSVGADAIIGEAVVVVVVAVFVVVKHQFCLIFCSFAITDKKKACQQRNLRPGG